MVNLENLEKMKYLALTFLGIFLVTSPITASNTQTATFLVDHPSYINDALKTLHKLPEVKALFQRVEKEGVIHVTQNHSITAQFGAFWEGYSRNILVNIGPKSTPGTILCSILFELHNAATDRDFAKLAFQASSGKLTKQEYVEKVERLEHSNAIKTVRLLEKGIREGYFPKTARWPIFENFEDHFRLQKQTGHSQWIANRYDEIRARSYNNSFNTIAQRDRAESYSHEQ